MSTLQAKKTKPKKKEVILSHAMKLFNERGFNDTRLEDIANELGKVKTSISYHFRSKEVLFYEAFEQSCAFKAKELDQAEKQANGLEQVIYFVRSRAELHAMALAGKIPPVKIFSDIEVIKTNARPEQIKNFEQQINRLCNFIRNGQDDGSIHIRSPEAGTFYLMNILHWLPHWLVNIPNAYHARSIDGLCDLLRNGMAASQNRGLGQSILQTPLNEYPAIFDRSTRNQLKRDAFLRTGTRFLNQTGFRNLSLNEVASELGVTRGAFYHYIADKDALLESCFDRTCETIDKALERALQHNGSDKLAAVELSLRALFEGHITDLDPLLRLNLLNSVSPTKRLAIEAKLKRLRASFSEIIAEAMVEGSVRPIDLEAFDNLLLGIIFAANHWRLEAMPLKSSWNPTAEPVAASAAYLEPLLKGFARKPMAVS